MTDDITREKVVRIRELLAAPLPDPADHCEPDCEHIECGFVVACERHTVERARLAQALFGSVLDALEAAWDQEKQTAAVLDGFLGDIEKAKNARVPLELKCPQCDMIHVDQDEWAHAIPHRTHLCHGCGNLWKPYPVGTVGVDVHAACREKISVSVLQAAWDVAEVAIKRSDDITKRRDELLKQADDQMIKYGRLLEEAQALAEREQAIISRLGADNLALIKRRDELLALVDKISRETPYPADLDECKSARAALIAEVGTLKSRITELEGRLEG